VSAWHEDWTLTKWRSAHEEWRSARSARRAGDPDQEAVRAFVAPIEIPAEIKPEIGLDLTGIEGGVVKQWRYQPLLLNGQPTEFILSVTVRFTFKGDVAR
jgi:hypothetical protein